MQICVRGGARRLRRNSRRLSAQRGSGGIGGRIRFGGSASGWARHNLSAHGCLLRNRHSRRARVFRTALARARLTWLRRLLHWRDGRGRRRGGNASLRRGQRAQRRRSRARLFRLLRSRTSTLRLLSLRRSCCGCLPALLSTRWVSRRVSRMILLAIECDGMRGRAGRWSAARSRTGRKNGSGSAFGRR